MITHDYKNDLPLKYGVMNFQSISIAFFLYFLISRQKEKNMVLFCVLMLSIQFHFEYSAKLEINAHLSKTSIIPIHIIFTTWCVNFQFRNRKEANL